MDRASKIAIVGAGISGLTLSIALRQIGFNNISIFDKDGSFDCRKQGYGLTILQGKGALKRIGVLQQVKRYNAYSKAHYIFDQKGSILGFYGTLFWDDKNNQRSLKSLQKGLSMHVPRQDLRKVLMAKNHQLSQSKIHWNKNLSSIQFNSRSANLVFNDGDSFEADAILGCDGIYSSVRKASIVQQTELNYLGVMVVLGICNSHGLSDNRVFQTADGQFRLFSMPFIPQNPHLSSMWQLSFRMDLSKAKYYASRLNELKSFISERLGNWHEPIPQMIASTDIQNIMPIIAYDRDPDLPLLKDPRVILLGDALHPMSPFKGQGANQALIDAVQLAQEMGVCNKIENLKTAMVRMLDRASLKLISSRQRVIKYHEPSFTQIENFIYPGVDAQLIRLLKQERITAKDGANLEALILKVMKEHQYL